ncbi:hypothetical protein FNV43_RR06948 [Rhamnella rubrinervis]|uniref:F-box domain-containing protein n=1 Tax=Rhamnella rubrinervis TaxID=2594499 RepID=A0A8K0MLW9_9ROSA|nr:hypothetical protein FNV43_RR06948 [Rhamnella rubrinervis]
MDLISELPESLVHHILDSLPTKDVVRTSCLSKTWRRIRSSYPTVNFIQRYFHPPNVFQEFMKHSLQSFITNKSGVERFKLCMAHNDPELNCLINQWINYVANCCRVEEVNINMKENTRLSAIGMPFASNTLIKLHLCGCDLLDIKPSIINLPHLRKLVMKDIMDLDDTLVENLILGCPLLEDLQFELCDKLTRLQVSNLNSIKKISVRYCHRLQSVEVRAPSLESFAFRGFIEMGVVEKCEIDLAACETTLKDLNLSIMNVTSDWLQHFISKFVCLESLFLFWIPYLETIKISSPKLKKFDIGQCLELGEATVVDAPLVHALNCSYNKLPFYNISASNLEGVELNFTLGDHDDVWLNTLRDFFKKTIHIQNFKVAVILRNREEGDRVITHELTDSVFVVWQQLKYWNLDVFILSATPEHWIQDLLEVCRCKKMCIAGYENSSGDILRALEEELSKRNMEAAADREEFGKDGNGLYKNCKGRGLQRLVEAGRTNLAQENELKEEDEEDITCWIPLLKAYQTLYNNNIICVDLKREWEPLSRCRGCLNCMEWKCY